MQRHVLRVVFQLNPVAQIQENGSAELEPVVSEVPKEEQEVQVLPFKNCPGVLQAHFLVILFQVAEAIQLQTPVVLLNELPPAI